MSENDFFDRVGTASSSPDGPITMAHVDHAMRCSNSADVETSKKAFIDALNRQLNHDLSRADWRRVVRSMDDETFGMVWQAMQDRLYPL
jgi:hypothetical protein